MPKKLKETDTIPYLSDVKGLYKKKLLKNKKDFDKLCDYLEKIKWSIEDFNKEFLIKDKWEQKDIVFVLILTCWIWYTSKKIVELYQEDIVDKFNTEQKDKFSDYHKYIRAIRSFTIAHPLETTQCSNYGFDGDWICVDICTSNNLNVFSFDNSNIYHLTVHSLEHTYCKQDDIFLHAYSNKNGEYKYFKKIGMSSNDLVICAKFAINRLAKLNTYLVKQKP